MLEPWSPTPVPETKIERSVSIRQRPVPPGTVPSLGCGCHPKKPCNEHARGAPRRPNSAFIGYPSETLAYWESRCPCLGKIEAASYPTESKSLFEFRHGLRLVARARYPDLTNTNSEAYLFLAHFLCGGMDVPVVVPRGALLTEFLPGATVHYHLEDCIYYILPDRAGFYCKSAPSGTRETITTGTWTNGPVVHEVSIVYQTSSTGYECVVVEQWDTYHGLGTVCTARDITVFATKCRALNPF